MLEARSLLILIFAVLGIKTSTLDDGSKYDFDHKLLKSVVELEHDHGVMKYLLRNYQQLEDTNRETAKILESMQNTMRDIDEALKSQDVSIRAVEDKVDGLSTETEKSLKLHAEKIGHLETGLQNFPGTGTTFTRWGRPDCPETKSSLVYSGHVGGSTYSHTGAASNYLCLTKEPLWNQQVATKYPTYLYGGEYEFYDHTTFGAGLVNKEPPCAVCRSPRSTVIMIPGRNVCYGGWTTEYSGYMVAGYHTHAAAAEFVCLDGNATTADRSDSSNQNGKLMYMVRTSCGSLQCPPYKHDWTVTCVVCSK